MFDELTKYKTSSIFVLKKADSLKTVCNAPTDKSGVYLVYARNKGKEELIYVGISGKKQKDGSMFIRKAGLGGLKDRIVNGHQFGKVPRYKSWITKMEDEKIDAIVVYWYITHTDKYNDCPRFVEMALLTKYLHRFGCLPKWNKKFEHL